MNTPTDYTEQYDLMLTFYSYADDETFVRMAVPQRNEILDELRRREQTIEARAEARKAARHG